jgi:hypothetical protein
MIKADKDPQIDEAVWRAWVEKRDKFRFASRLKVMVVVAVFLTVSALLWRFLS